MPRLCAPTLSVLVSVPIMALSAPARAHEPGPLTEHIRWPFPDPVTAGAAGLGHFIGPTEDYRITHARMHIVFVTDGTVDPRDALVGLSSQVNGSFADWKVTGADLGWIGTGLPATFTADIETDALNGDVWRFPLFPHSFLDFEWFSLGSHPDNYFAAESWFEVQIVPVPTPGTLAPLAAAGMLTLRRRRR